MGDLMRRRMELMAQPAPNLYAGGDQTFTLFKTDVPLTQTLQPGTYRFSAQISTTDRDSDRNLVIFFQTRAGESGAVSVYMDRQSQSRPSTATFVLQRAVSYMALYASDSYMGSTGDQATYSNIRVERIA